MATTMTTKKSNHGGVDDDKHVVHADPQHQKGQHAHEGAVEEAEGGADAKAADDGHPDGEDPAQGQQAPEA
eukprot:scaffold508573_cov37-Prasinocladus_malaysianus.AAC.1